MVQTFSLIDSEKTNKLNDINKCFEDACNIVEQIKNLKNTIESENNQSKKNLESFEVEVIKDEEI